MNHLPFPIIAMIISYLKIHDRCAFRQTCKQIARHKPLAEEYLVFIKFLKNINAFEKENEGPNCDGDICICRCSSRKLSECYRCGINVCGDCSLDYWVYSEDEDDNDFCYFCINETGCTFCGEQVKRICYVCKKLICSAHTSKRRRKKDSKMPMCLDCQI